MIERFEILPVNYSSVVKAAEIWRYGPELPTEILGQNSIQASALVCMREPTIKETLVQAFVQRRNCSLLEMKAPVRQETFLLAAANSPLFCKSVKCTPVNTKM